jgi:hypothetical protein
MADLLGLGANAMKPQHHDERCECGEVRWRGAGRGPASGPARGPRGKIRFVAAPALGFGWPAPRQQLRRVRRSVEGFAARCDFDHLPVPSSLEFGPAHLLPGVPGPIRHHRLPIPDLGHDGKVSVTHRCDARQVRGSEILPLEPPQAGFQTEAPGTAQHFRDTDPACAAPLADFLGRGLGTAMAQYDCQDDQPRIDWPRPAGVRSHVERPPD